MINVKGGTKTWSDAPQRTDFKSDGAQNMSAADKSKFFDGESIGDTLNRVADPNFVDESKKMRTTGNNQLGKDAFMTLLLTQMKNQDPTNPLKSHEMAAQLAQFTSLEKLHNINDGIEGLRKDNQPNHNLQALAFIGKSVMTDNSKVVRGSPDERHDVRFNLPADAQKVTMQVKDASGNVIRTIETKSMKAGKNEMNWNGMTEEGVPAPVGDYSVSLEAVASNGRKLFVETKTEGIISGVNFTPRGPQLLVGRQVINMSDVKSISEPNLQAQQELSTPSTPAPTEASSESPKKGEVKAETRTDGAKRARLSQGSLEDAAMTQDFINKLNKSGAKAGGMQG